MFSKWSNSEDGGSEVAKKEGLGAKQTQTDKLVSRV